MLEIQHKPEKKLVKPKVSDSERKTTPVFSKLHQSLMTDDRDMSYFIQITPANHLLSHKTARIDSEHFNQEERTDSNCFDAMDI